MSIEAVAIALYVANKVKARLGGSFETDVIRRWSRYRAERFFDSFAHAVELEHDQGEANPEVDAKLEEILTDEKKSEALFDAYRRVVLSASKELGPRILGILTAELINEDRVADQYEEKVLGLAEVMSDRELIAFDEFCKQKGIEPASHTEAMRVTSEFVIYSTESTTHGSRTLNLVEIPGMWAVKLKNAGALIDSLRERQRTVHPQGEPETITMLEWSLKFPEGTTHFLRLIRRARKMTATKG